MAQLADIQAAQKNLEDCFVKKLGELEAQIQSAGPAKDTVAKIAEEFRTFRELMFSMLGLLRSQINECSKAVDDMETRSRRKALIFTGFVEVDKEDTKARILDIINNKLGLKDLSLASIKVCHRLGMAKPQHHRPILVKFFGMEHKTAVWRAKSALKGSPVSVREFLTKTRQALFGRARYHFGMKACWSQDGTVIIKSPDGHRHKVTSVEDLNPILAKYPRSNDLPVQVTNKTAKGVRR